MKSSVFEPYTDPIEVPPRDDDQADVCLLFGDYCERARGSWGLSLGDRVQGGFGGEGPLTGFVARSAPGFTYLLQDALAEQGLDVFDLSAERLAPSSLAVVRGQLARGRDEPLVLVRPPRPVGDSDLIFGTELALVAAAHGYTFRVAAPSRGLTCTIARSVHAVAETVRDCLLEEIALGP